MSDDEKKSVPFFATPVGTIANGILLWILACILAAVAVIVLEMVEVPEDGITHVLLTYLAFAPATVVTALSIVYFVIGAIRWAMFGPRSSPRATADLGEMATLLKSINERLLLSETAKKINYRGEDLRVLRKTLEDDIKRGEFGAAMVLVTELASTYGQLEEAEKYRGQIESARRQDQEDKVAAGITRLEAHLAEQNFAAANAESARLQRLYPDSEAVGDLPHRVTVAKEQYKQELKRALLQASERDEIDQALELMKTLDKLLSPAEAEPLREVARGVFGKKRDNLGVQFSVAVHDREWTQAVIAGEQIIKQFPNTRMADEVRQRIDQLRANAGGQQNAAPVDPPPASALSGEQKRSGSDTSGAATSNTGISFTVTE